MEQLYTISLAGLTLPCAFHYPEAARALNAFPSEEKPPLLAGEGDRPQGRWRGSSDICIRSSERSEQSILPIPPVFLPPEEWKYFLTGDMTESAGSEANILTAFFSEALMPYDRCVIHAVAIRWKGQAWLISAPSGVGKSTQARYLQALRPGEFDVICGDRPILEFCSPAQPKTSPACRGGGPASRPVEGSSPSSHRDPVCAEASASIIVHPSPWNGKERWHGAPAAPLGGVILLERGEENALELLKPREAGIPAYLQIIHANRDTDILKKTAALATALAETVPVWKLTTHQVPDSTKLLLASVFPTPTL